MNAPNIPLANNKSSSKYSSRNGIVNDSKLPDPGDID